MATVPHQNIQYEEVTEGQTDNQAVIEQAYNDADESFELLHTKDLRKLEQTEELGFAIDV